MASRYLTGLSGVYAQLDSDHTLYVGGSDRVTAYGEVDPADPTSAIEVKRVWPAGDTNLSDIVPGGLVGFNMTFDGWIIIVTDQGWMVALSRDFQQVYTVQLNFAERDAEMVYTVGARDGLWTLEGVDFCSGRSNFHYVVGGSRYNSLFSGVHLDEEGRIIYGNPFGKLHLDVN